MQLLKNNIVPKSSHLTTRMHSSRMRSGRSLTVCRSLLPGGVLSPGGMCLVPGGVCSGRGVCAPGGVSQHALRQTPPGLSTSPRDVSYQCSTMCTSKLLTVNNSHQNDTKQMSQIIKQPIAHHDGYKSVSVCIQMAKSIGGEM